MYSLAVLALLIMGSNFKTVFVMVVKMWRCWVLMFAILLLLPLKELAIVVIFMTLENFKEILFLTENSMFDDRGNILNASQRNQF